MGVLQLGCGGPGCSTSTKCWDFRVALPATRSRRHIGRWPSGIIPMSMPGASKTSGAPKRSIAPTRSWAMPRRVPPMTASGRSRTRRAASAHGRTAARRRFWLSAATGAATVIVMVSSVWVMAVWRQDASIPQSQGSEPAVLAEDASPAQKPTAQIVANRGPAGSGDRDGRDETVIASVPELFGEPPSSTARAIPSTPRGDSETQAAAPSQPIAEPPPPEKIASAQPSAPAPLTTTR